MKRHDDEQKVAEFLKSNRTPVPDREKKERDMLLFQTLLMERHLYGKKTFVVRIREQAEFIHPISWIAQFIIVLMGIFFTKVFDAEAAIMEISFMIPLIGITGSFEMTKCFYYNMWELEMSCRYDGREIAGVKMFLFGFCDLVILMILSCLVYRAGGGLAEIGLKILVPFNISTGIYLLVIDSAWLRKNNLLLLYAGGLMAGMEILIWSWIEKLLVIVEGEAVAMALVVSLVFLFGMGLRYYRNGDRKDEILWSLN